jgi:hypothetical protein
VRLVGFVFGPNNALLEFPVKLSRIGSPRWTCFSYLLLAPEICLAVNSWVAVNQRVREFVDRKLGVRAGTLRSGLDPESDVSNQRVFGEPGNRRKLCKERRITQKRRGGQSPAFLLTRGERFFRSFSPSSPRRTLFELTLSMSRARVRRNSHVTCFRCMTYVAVAKRQFHYAPTCSSLVRAPESNTLRTFALARVLTGTPNFRGQKLATIQLTAARIFLPLRQTDCRRQGTHISWRRGLVTVRRRDRVGCG